MAACDRPLVVAARAAFVFILGLLIAANLLTGSGPDPKLISGLLAWLAALTLLSRRKSSAVLLALLFTASAWNYFVNARVEYGRIHYHDAGHYYLGSRYFDELGYFHLYDGVLRVLSETRGSAELPEQVRDLRDNRLVDAGELLERRRLTEADFSDPSWRAFGADVGMIVTGLGPGLEPFLRDHGYNPTPVWTWLARPLAESVPPGNHTGLFLLSLIDPLLLLTVIAALWWAWGRDAALLAGTYLLVMFGSFSWIGGSFCRVPWLALLIWGFCCLKKGRTLPAGGLVALAAILRIFPVLFLVPLLLKALRGHLRGRRIARRHRRLAAGAGVTALAAIAGATASLGVGAWVEFFENMQAYVRIDVSNAVGFQKILGIGAVVVGLPPASVSWMILAVCGLLAAIVALAASRSRDLVATAGGALLCFLVFDLAAYYYGLLVLPFLVARDDRSRAGFFAVEVVCHLVHFAFDAGPHVTFLVRNLLVGLLLLAPWLDRGVREAAARWERIAYRFPGLAPRAAQD